MLADERVATVAAVEPVTADDVAASVALARHHLSGRVAVPLCDTAPTSNDDAWPARLADAGVTVASPRALAVG